MFTGIIEATAKVREKTATTLTIGRPATFDDIRAGCSIAVSGVCLTVTTFDDASMSFDVVPETWAKTKLGALKVEDRVNLERALRADGRFDGHVVQGHIEGTAEVVSVSPEGEGVRMTLHIPLELVPFVVPKGSIALDGVSLTVAQAKSSECSVALIPTTLRETTLGGLEAGDTINIETDIFLRALLHAKR